VREIESDYATEFLPHIGTERTRKDPENTADAEAVSD